MQTGDETTGSKRKTRLKKLLTVFCRDLCKLCLKEDDPNFALISKVNETAAADASLPLPLLCLEFYVAIIFKDSDFGGGLQKTTPCQKMNSFLFFIPIFFDQLYSLVKDSHTCRSFSTYTNKRHLKS